MEDVVMTGADDFTLQVWKVSEQENKTCPAGKIFVVKVPSSAL